MIPVPQRVYLALALTGLNAFVRAAPVSEISSFLGSCSEDKCTNVFATFDITNSDQCEEPLVRTVTGAAMTVQFAPVVDAIKIQLGSKNYNTAQAATEQCTEDLIAQGAPCTAFCGSENGAVATPQNLTNCNILGGDQVDVLEYFLYTGSPAIDDCPSDDPEICPYLFVLAQSDDFEAETGSFDVYIDLNFTVDCAERNCKKNSYNSTKTFNCNADQCASTFTYYYGTLGDVGFDPTRCQITYAHLTASVNGDYGAGTGVQFYVGSTLDPKTDGFLIPQADIKCKGSPGQCTGNFDECLVNFDVSQYLDPSNSYIMNLVIDSDDTISDNCPNFGTKANLEYQYTCDCFPTPQPTFPRTSKPSAVPTPKPTPKPTHKPSAKPTSVPAPNPTPMPTSACHSETPNWQQQSTQDVAGPVPFQLFDQVVNVNRTCQLNKATLYMALDNKTTPFESMGSVNVLIGSKDFDTAEMGAETACTAGLFSAGAPCKATCNLPKTEDECIAAGGSGFQTCSADGTVYCPGFCWGEHTCAGTSQFHNACIDDNFNSDSSWPMKFAEWSAQEGVSYNSCNEFYELDVTSYLQYADFSGCSAEVIDPATCPTLALIITNSDFKGGTPAFEAQVSLSMDLACNCVPTPVESVTLERSMVCSDVGDCPVTFVFPVTDGGNVPFDASTCQIGSATLELTSRGYRTKPPTVFFSSGNKTNSDLSSAVVCGANNGTACNSPAKDFDECFETGPLDVMYLIDKPMLLDGTIATVTIYQSTFVDENCPDAEMKAIFTWTYTCTSSDDEGAGAKQIVSKLFTQNLRGGGNEVLLHY